MWGGAAQQVSGLGLLLKPQQDSGSWFPELLGHLPCPRHLLSSTEDFWMACFFPGEYFTLHVSLQCHISLSLWGVLRWTFLSWLFQSSAGAGYHRLKAAGQGSAGFPL